MKNTIYRGEAFSLVQTAIMIGLLAICVLAAPSSFAGNQSQVDSNTNQLIALSTNTYALYGDTTGTYTNGLTLNQPNSFIDASKTTSAQFECGGYFTNNTASPTNVNFYIYQSVALNRWTFCTNVLVTVPGLTTNWCFTQFALAASQQTLFPAYALRQAAVTNAAGVGTTPPGSGSSANGIYFRGFTHTGM